MTSSCALVTQRLSEFLAVVSACADASTATRVAVARAVEALDAQVAAVVCDVGVAAAEGPGAHHVPAADLAALVAGSRTTISVPGAGECATLVVPAGGVPRRHLVVGRAAAFTADDVSFVEGMARVLELSLDALDTLDAERRQAAENARLVATLQGRQRLLEQLSAVQRAITRRAPLQHILDTITAGAQELFDEDAVGLRLCDSDDPSMLLLVSSHGLPEDTAKRMWRVPLTNAGVAGRAVQLDELVLIEAYEASPYRIPELADVGIRAAMAAPVHDNGRVVGSLVVGSTRPGRTYSKGDQEMLLAFAEHVSLAVTDANTLEAMHQAFHDTLTGLASRGLFMDRLGHSLAVADRERSRVAVLCVDVDRFKVVNDSLGRAAGDQLLIGVAGRLQSCLRGSDTAARLGGDEFAVLLHDVTEAEQAGVVAERIIATLREPFYLGGTEVFVGCSVGIGFSQLGERNVEALMQNADLAMHEAKRKGKGRSEIFDPGMHASLRKNLDMEADLRRAVARNEFVLRYQPIVALNNRQIIGVEALVRWIHPARGMVPPLDFIPLAEETGLILPIGEWVLREACRQVSQWNAARSGQPPLSISVNLSARQLQQVDLARTVSQVLRETGLDPGNVVLEITESLLVHDTVATTERLRALKALGVRLAIDDFGTGYSSLAYLRQFPVDILKIDKSFVDELGSGGKASALAPAIVRLGQTLELCTVAEGIELAEQYGELFDSGCELGQGYYFAKPLDSTEIEAILGPAAATLPPPEG
jgi:diguanylate cyclase (GGDEF)-like protein